MEALGVNYIYPTPIHNSKSSKNNFTILIYDDALEVTSANVSINGINYTMDDIGLGYFRYINSTVNTNNSIILLEFQVFTNIGKLELRSFKIYPFIGNNYFPAFGLMSFVLGLLIIFVGVFLS